MELLAGVTLALLTSISATMTGLDRDRGFYPVVLVVIASYYDLFAVMGGSAQAFSLETLAMVVFIAASLVGFGTSLWLVVTALVGHGVFDFVHAHLIANPGVPAWWPKFCLSYDIMAASYLGWLLTRPHAIRAADVKARADDRVTEPDQIALHGVPRNIPAGAGQVRTWVAPHLPTVIGSGRR